MPADANELQRDLSATYREAFTAMPAPLVMLDTSLRILDVNEAYLVMLALERTTLIGRQLFEVFPASEEAADDAATAETVLRQAITTGTTQQLPVFQYDTETESGSGTFARRWWRMTAVPLLGYGTATDRSEDAPLAAAVLYRLEEVTDTVLESRRAVTAEAQVAGVAGREARLAEVVESMAVGYLSLDRDWRVTYVNTEGRRVLDAAERELVGEVLWELFPATVGTLYEENYRHAVSTGEVVTFDAYYPEPLNAWFELRATPEGDGMALYFLDITARRAAQDAAELASRRLLALGQVALALAGAEDITDLVTVMAEQGISALGADGGAVAVPDPHDPGVLLSYITASYGSGAQAEFGRLPVGTALPVCQAYRTGQRVLLPDLASSLAHSPLMQDVIAATGSSAWTSVPLRAGGRVVGVLTAGWREEQPFDAEQLDLLDTYAAQCAQALQRLAAFQAEQAAAAHARQSTAKQAALVAIALALDEAHTEQAVLSVVTGRGVALLGAQGAVLSLAGPSGGPAARVRALTTAFFNDSVQSEVAELPSDFPLPMVHTATTGTAHYFSDQASAVAAFPGGAELYTAARTHASAAVPLRAGGAVFGSLSVAFDHDHAWPQDERDLLEAFAALTAQTLERISAREAERAASAEVARFSETLQRSLLTAPPEPNHLQVAVRYSPAAEKALVGGDWYDAFITSAGTTSLVIGDVTGHDSRAAAAMAQYRNLLRGIGYTIGEPPALVLSALDRAVHDLGVTALATVILAEVEQSPQQAAARGGAGLRTLRWSNAGHPAPLLISADGTARYLDSEPDLLLGLDPDARRSDHTAVLEPGDSVLLFTDGLIERRGVDLLVGMDWLAGAAARLAHLPLEELCDALLALVGGGLEDDIALLALRAHPEDRPRPSQAGPNRDPRQDPVLPSTP